MTGPFATRFFRIIFVLAGCYNLAIGLWAALWPLQFFNLFALLPPRYPSIWACLGMVVGLYGLLYLRAAWKLENGWPIIAVGLLGKLLGPIGMALNISDQWPLRIAMILVFNDAIWWTPFALFLLRGTRIANRLVLAAPWFCAALHTLALAGILVALRPGLLTESDILHRATYIAQHPSLWAAGWIVWMMSAVSLVAFYAWWASHLISLFAATLAVLIAAAGSVCDFAGESLSATVLVERTSQLLDPVGFNLLERVNLLLTAGVANLLYTLGGIILTLCTPNLPARMRALMWATWLAGVAMTIAASFNYIPGVVATTVILFPPFIVWVAWIGYRGRPS